jgi:hypothetical protein
MVGVMCGEEEGDITILPDYLFQPVYHPGMFIHLAMILPAELIPLRWLVTIPLPEFRACSRLFYPEIDLCTFFCHTPRPEPFYKHPEPVAGGGRIIYPFQPDCHGRSDVQYHEMIFMAMPCSDAGEFFLPDARIPERGFIMGYDGRRRLTT